MLLKVQTKNMIVEDFGDECVVYDIKRKKAHCLNKSVKWIWEQCDGSKTADEIAGAFQTRFGSPDASVLVSAGIDQLAAANLLSFDGFVEGGAIRAEMTRREVVAAASLLAPVITSILIPTPAAAKSKEEKPGDVKPPKPPKVK